jgi:hypothetical protein
MKKFTTVIGVMLLSILVCGCGMKNTAETYTADAEVSSDIPRFKGKKIAVFARWAPDCPEKPLPEHPYLTTGYKDILERTASNGSQLNESTSGQAVLSSMQTENQFQYMLAAALEHGGAVPTLVLINPEAFEGTTGKQQREAEAVRLMEIIERKLAEDGYDYFVFASDRRVMPGQRSILEIDGHHGSEFVRGFLTLGLDKLVASDTDTHTYSWSRNVKVTDLRQGRAVYEQKFLTNESRDISVHEGSLVKTQSKYIETLKFETDIHAKEVRRVVDDMTRKLAS